MKSISRAARKYNFWGKQNKFIANDLSKRNKTAWLLPDYKAKQFSRIPYQEESSQMLVSTHIFNQSLKILLEGEVPLLIIKSVLSISGSGLMESWSHLINRRDLLSRRESEPPVKPTMSGNVQIVFLLLPVQMSVPLILVILELNRYIVGLLRATWCSFSLFWMLKKFENTCHSIETSG